MKDQNINANFTKYNMYNHDDVLIKKKVQILFLYWHIKLDLNQYVKK